MAASLWMLLASATPAAGVETNLIRIANHTPPSLPASGSSGSGTNLVHEAKTRSQRAEALRTVCINGRRYLCGQVVQIVPQGLVVDSGYTNLMRPELKGSWLVRGNVSASRPLHLVEGKTPDSICAGLVFVTDIPRKPAVNLYDYVAIEAYPDGDYLYAPVPNVKKNIRRFSVGLLTAVELNLDAGEQ